MAAMYFDPYDHGESIYNIIPPTEVKQEKPPMYRSRHKPTVPPSCSTFGTEGSSHPLSKNMAGELNERLVPSKACRTMGKAPGTSKNAPTDYMKSGTRVGKVAPLKDVKEAQPHLLKPTQLKPKLKPDVPRKEEVPVMNLVTSKNFVVANAVEAILAAPKKVSQGAKEYLHKEDYGKVPKYLKHIKSDIEAEYDYIRQLQQSEAEAISSQLRPLGEEERLALIEGLKKKWETVNSEYQASTHLTKLDSIGKIKRKEKCEAEIQQIEKDIERLNRRNILVARDM